MRNIVFVALVLCCSVIFGAQGSEHCQSGILGLLTEKDMYLIESYIKEEHIFHHMIDELSGNLDKEFLHHVHQNLNQLWRFQRFSFFSMHGIAWGLAIHIFGLAQRGFVRQVRQDYLSLANVYALTVGAVTLLSTYKLLSFMRDGEYVRRLYILLAIVENRLEELESLP